MTNFPSGSSESLASSRVFDKEMSLPPPTISPETGDLEGREVSKQTPSWMSRLIDCIKNLLASILNFFSSGSVGNNELSDRVSILEIDNQTHPVSKTASKIDQAPIEARIVDKPTEKATKIKGIKNETEAKKEFGSCQKKTIDRTTNDAKIWEIDKTPITYEGQPAKDRYTDIQPAKETRVGQNFSDNFYINANHVELHGIQYIQSQGPKHETIKDFWRMIVEEKPSIIVNLTAEEEGGREKCFAYWKSDNLPKPKDLPEGWTVTAEHTENPPGSEVALVQGKFILCKGDERREIPYVHHLKWPDHGVPDTSEAKPLNDILKKMNDAKREGGPILCNCSAGVGRSGALMVAHSTINHVQQQLNEKKTPTVNIQSTVLEGRKQRNPAFVQRPAQHVLIHQLVGGWNYNLG